MIYQVKSFSFVFLENLGHHKLLSKLTDLYKERSQQFSDQIMKFGFEVFSTLFFVEIKKTV